MASIFSSDGRTMEIESILNGLDRYDPAATTSLQEYVEFQCKNGTYDLSANLALLKLYQINPHLMRDRIVTNILAKALLTFPSPDFSLCLALLPPYILIPQSESPSISSPFSEAVQKLDALNSLLSTAHYAAFWSSLKSDTITQDLVADVSDFQSDLRCRISLAISQSMRSIQSNVLSSWINLEGDQFTQFVTETCGWSILDNGDIEIPANGENEIKSLFVRENVKLSQFGRLMRRALENKA